MPKLGTVIRIAILAVLLILVGVAGYYAFLGAPAAPVGEDHRPAVPDTGLTAQTPAASPTAELGEAIEPTPTPVPTPTFHTPAAHESALPKSFGFVRELELDGETIERFTREVPISFGEGGAYTQLPGVLTFRGNNYRDAEAYGTAEVKKKTLKLGWTVNTGSMAKGISGDGSWTGSGWVGQPLIVQWPESTKQIMNLYDSAKQKEGLVEVILATMDGNVYFTDLETGEATRDKLKIGMPFKGAGSLDPRGYPLLYLGSGDGYNEDARDTRAMVYSLIDFTRLYEFGKRQDPFNWRTWHAYDSAPLVHAETDTLFYPGENGILYSMRLNTEYDEAAGTISVAPTEVLKYRYKGERNADKKYYLGFEDSAVVWQSYMYLADNGGLFQCIDLNTMDIVWVQDTWDDTNGTPVLEVVAEDHTAYLYIGTSLRINADSEGTGEVAFFKLDACTGEVVWKDVRKVRTVSGVSGGIQATAVVGRGNIDDLVIIPFARTPGRNSGILVALDKQTGSERWKLQTEGYSWSSPIAIYDAAGKAYIVVADSQGHVYLIDGAKGELLDTLSFEANNFEASPAAYGNTIVLGSRSAKIYGIRVE